MAGKRSADERSEDIIAATSRLVLAQRTVAIPVSAIAGEIGVSRPLIYMYFDDVGEIVDILFRRYLARVATAWRMEQKKHGENFEAASAALFTVYFDDIVEHGALIQLALRERAADSPLGPKSARAFRALLLEIGRGYRHHLLLEPRAALVLFELLAAIPERLADLVRRGEIDTIKARFTVQRLVLSAIRANRLSEE